MKVKLLKPHTHAGKPRAAGDQIEVSEPVARWLADPKRQVIAPLPASAGKTPTEEKK